MTSDLLPASHHLTLLYPRLGGTVCGAK